MMTTDTTKVWRLFFLFVSCTLVKQTAGVCGIKCSKCEANKCTECYYGYWGYNCHRECTDCWLGGCEKDSGRCIQCRPGRYGVHCDKPCPHNCWSTTKDEAFCNRHLGKCLDGCESGWWGDQCQNKCSDGCQESCLQVDGACISDCRRGFFGRFCSKICSAGCAEESCDWLTGNCHGGCKCGYRGDTCEDDCSRNCNEPCKPNKETGCLVCKHKCEGNCIKDKCYRNGSCTDGCQDGFYGEDCLNTCPSHCSACKEGINCSSCFKENTGKPCQRVTDEAREKEEAEEYQQSDHQTKDIEMEVKASNCQSAVGDDSLKRAVFAVAVLFVSDRQ